jgi:diamine N-acetyltransferase
MSTPEYAGPTNATSIHYVEGEHVALGPFTAQLVPQYWRWEQEPAVIAGLGRQTPESLEARVAGYEAQARSLADQARFTVHRRLEGDQWQPVGTTALRIDHYVRTAEYVIVLGAEGRGHRLAQEATALTLDYAFRITNLRMVWLKVLEHNTAAIRAYEGAGFKPVGSMRRAGYWYGRECSELIMDATAEDIPNVAIAPTTP